MGQQPLAAHRLDQRRVLGAARRDPSERLRLGGAAFGKTRRSQAVFDFFQRGRPLGPHAVHRQVLEQARLLSM